MVAIPGKGRPKRLSDPCLCGARSCCQESRQRRAPVLRYVTVRSGRSGKGQANRPMNERDLCGVQIPCAFAPSRLKYRPLSCQADTGFFSCTWIDSPGGSPPSACCHSFAITPLRCHAKCPSTAATPSCTKFTPEKLPLMIHPCKIRHFTPGLLL
jgi:hypothetical protein